MPKDKFSVLEYLGYTTLPSPQTACFYAISGCFALAAAALALALAVTAGGLATADEPPLPVPALTLAAVGGVAPCGTTTHRTLSLALETERTVTVVGAVLTAVG